MMAAKAERPPKVTTVGPCPHCGHRCMAWKHAVLTEAGHVDGDALMVAHGVEAAEVVHDKDDKIIMDEHGEHPGAVPLVHMVHAPTATFTKHGGRIAPIPPQWKGPRR